MFHKVGSNWTYMFYCPVLKGMGVFTDHSAGSTSGPGEILYLTGKWKWTVTWVWALQTHSGFVCLWVYHSPLAENSSLPPFNKNTANNCSSGVGGWWGTPEGSPLCMHRCSCWWCISVLSRMDPVEVLTAWWRFVCVGATSKSTASLWVIALVSLLSIRNKCAGEKPCLLF